MEIDRDRSFECFLRFLLTDEFPHILRQEPEQFCDSEDLPPLLLKKPKLEVDHGHEDDRSYVKENYHRGPYLCPGRFPPLRTTEPKVKVQFLGLKKEYEKVQSRVNRQSRQRLADAKVRMIITADAQIAHIDVYVERAPMAAALSGDVIGRVPLKVKMGAQMINKQYLSVDLDSVYMSSKGTPVYKLSTVDSDRRNRFRLVVAIVFIDGSQSKAFVSPTFLLRSRRPERLKSV